MAVFDAHRNLALATVAVAPSPALSGTSLIITAGFVGLFPAVPFNCTIWPSTASPTDANAEIVRVTNIVGDIFTIVRAQEGTTAKAIQSGYRIGNTVTAKVFTDIENAMIMSISAGTSNATGNQVVFSNSNGVSFGASNNVITASFSGGGGGGGAAISAGGNSQSTGTVVFSNSNGVTFGLSNNGVLTASHNALTAQSTQPVAASASNGSFLFSTLGFSNANGVTFGTSAGSIITASVGTAAAGNSVNFSAGTESANLGSIVFSNSNGVSFGLDAGTITAQHNGLTSQSNQAFSAQGGSSAFQTLNFANSNGITFSNSNGSVVASHNGLTSQSNQAASASNGSFAFQTLAFSNANNVTFGTSAGSIITASVATAAAGNSVNFSAGTTSNNLASIVFSNSNGVSFGLDGSTITASANAGGGGVTLSSFTSPTMLLGGAANSLNINTQSYGQAFIFPQAISFNYVRFQCLMSAVQTTIATLASATATASAELYQTFNVVFYTLGTGANSQSLQSVASGSAGSTFQNSVSISNSTQGSYTLGITAPMRGGQTVLTTQYSISNTNYSFVTGTIASDFTGTRMFDVPLNTTLPAGNYWIIAGRSTSSASGGPAGLANMSNNRVSLSAAYFGSQQDLAAQELGVPNPAVALPLNGAATFATVGGGTQASINFSDLSRAQSGQKIYFQLLCSQ